MSQTIFLNVEKKNLGKTLDPLNTAYRGKKWRIVKKLK